MFSWTQRNTWSLLLTSLCVRAQGHSSCSSVCTMRGQRIMSIMQRRTDWSSGHRWGRKIVRARAQLRFSPFVSTFCNHRISRAYCIIQDSRTFASSLTLRLGMLSKDADVSHALTSLTCGIKLKKLLHRLPDLGPEFQKTEICQHKLSCR